MKRGRSRPAAPPEELVDERAGAIEVGREAVGRGRNVDLPARCQSLQEWLRRIDRHDNVIPYRKVLEAKNQNN